MIFKPLLVAQILVGRKTETRRPVRDGEIVCRYRPMRDYALQPGRGKEQIARIIVTLVGQERVGDLDDEAARREGFADRDGFIAYWRALYGGRWEPETRVWVIQFHLYAMPCALLGCGVMTPERYTPDMDLTGIWACTPEHAHRVLEGL